MGSHIETPSFSWPDGEPVESIISAGREPWDAPFLTWKGPGYESKEAFSPSGLQSWGECQRMAAFRYITGIREFEFTWPMLEHRPAPVHKDKRTQAKLTTIYNRRRGPALGKASHSIIEQYLRNVQSQSPSCDPATRASLPPVSKAQWQSLPGRVALSGLIHVPAPESAAWYEVEGPLQLTSECVLPEMEPIEFNGYRDLLVRYRDADALGMGIELFDWKTTGNFDYMPSADENALSPLAKFLLHPQPNMYALDVMNWQRLDWLDCTWVYFRTKSPPDARTVPFTVQRSQAESVVRSLALLADSIRTKMRAGLVAEEYPTNTEHCPKYGGCCYHKDRGGPCTAKTNFRATLVSLRRKPPHKKESQIMGFRNDRTAAAAATEGAAEDIEDTAEPAGEAEAEPAAAAPRPRGRPRTVAAVPGAAAPRAAATRGRPAAVAAPAPPTDDGRIVVHFGTGGENVTVAEGTPLYARLTKLYQANFG